jgi:ribose 5-phosphate isomerase B
MRIAIGCDDAAYHLKEVIKAYLMEQTDVPLEVEDFGTFSPEPVDYPDIAVKVAEAVADGRYDRAILLCGTGIGMCITANKVPGIRAALCHDVYSAERAQKSNNAQILTMGARVIGPELAKKIVEAWLKSHFAGGPSARKVAKIMEIEKAYTHPGGRVEPMPASPPMRGAEPPGRS